MRPLLIALAVVVLAGLPISDSAEPARAGAVEAGLRTFAASSGFMPVTVQKTKKKKKKSGSTSVTITEVAKTDRGERGVLLVASVGESGLTCKLTLYYRDGTDASADSVTSDSNGMCRMHFDVSTRRSVVGTATAKVVVVGSNGKEKGSHEQTFTVSDSK